MSYTDAAYWNSITDARALQADVDAMHKGSLLLSAECNGEDYGRTNLALYAQDNFAGFLRLLRYLSPSEQDAQLSYVLLGLNQHGLGTILGFTQTVMSQRLRLSDLVLAFLLREGVPSMERMAEILADAGHPVETARWVYLYRDSWNFAMVAKQLGIHRPSIKKGISAMSKTLLEDKSTSGLGAYYSYIIQDKSASGVGKSRAALRRPRELTRKDPDCLGSFRLRITDEGFEKMFLSKSTAFVSNEEDD
jgi:hypothetical protein